MPRPNPNLSSQLVSPIDAETSTIPVQSIAQFRLDTRKRIGESGEIIRCTGTQDDPWPALTGCERGISQEESGVEARSWDAGTPVFEMPWTAVEIVDEIPVPTLDMAGRQFQYRDENGDVYTFNVVVNQDQVPAIDWVNEPPATDEQTAWDFTWSLMTGLNTVQQAVAVAAIPGGGNIREFMGGTTPNLYAFSATNVVTAGSAPTRLIHLAADATYVWGTRDDSSIFRRANSLSGPTSEFGSAGTGDGQFNGPVGIISDGASVFVADTGNNRIQQLSSAGAYLNKFGGFGSASGQMSGPRDLAFDPSRSEIYVLDNGNRRVQVFSATTFAWLRTIDIPNGNAWGQVNWGAAESIVVDSSLNIWISDAGNNRVSVFDAAGVMFASVGSFGTGAKEFKTPGQMQILADGVTVWVTDVGGGRWPVLTLVQTTFGSRVTERSGAAITVPASGNASGTALCAAGEVSIGGGMSSTGTRQYLAGSRRNGSNGWTIDVRNDSGVNTAVTPYVVCLRDD